LVFGQNKAEWTALENGVEYQWISKKAIKGTSYAIWKLKVRNTSPENTVEVKFTVNEYEGVKLVGRSEEQQFCLKPDFMEVIKIQLLYDGESDDNQLEHTRELDGISVVQVESCKE
jgi:hypothetical protein